MVRLDEKVLLSLMPLKVSRTTASLIYKKVKKMYRYILKKFGYAAVFPTPMSEVVIASLAAAYYIGVPPDKKALKSYIKTPDEVAESLRKEGVPEKDIDMYLRAYKVVVGEVADYILNSDVYKSLHTLTIGDIGASVYAAVRQTLLDREVKRGEVNPEKIREIIREIKEFLEAYRQFGGSVGKGEGILEFMDKWGDAETREKIAELMKFDKIVKKLSKLLAKKMSHVKPKDLAITSGITAPLKPGEPISAAIKTDLAGFAFKNAEHVRLWQISKIASGSVRTYRVGRRLFPIMMIDVSGSMSGAPLYFATALGMALIKAAGDGAVALFDTSIRYIARDKKEAVDALLSLNEEVLGGTCIWCAMRELMPMLAKLKNKKPYVFIISDFCDSPPYKEELEKWLKATGTEGSLILISLSDCVSVWKRSLKDLIKRKKIVIIDSKDLLDYFVDGWRGKMNAIERFVKKLAEEMRA